MNDTDIVIETTELTPAIKLCLKLGAATAEYNQKNLAREAAKKAYDIAVKEAEKAQSEMAKLQGEAFIALRDEAIKNSKSPS